MNNKVSSVLNSIEKIDNLIMEADVSVSDAMSDVYSKQFKMEGNVTEDYINHEYYQESVIAGILIGGGIIAVLATAIVLITKHVKKSASGDPEKKNDTSTAAGTALDNQEELKKKVEQIKGELDKAGGSVEITNNGINTTELNKKFELVTKLCDSAEGFLKEKEDDLIKQEIENFTKQLEEINKIQYKSSETVTVSADSLTKIIDLAAPIKTMNDKLTKTAEELTKRSKENKNKSDSETDSDKKEKYNELKEGLERISKDSTQLSKDLTDDLNAIRSYMDAILKAAKEKAKPSETESEKSQETSQNLDFFKQKIGPTISQWTQSSSNSDDRHPSIKLTEDEAYNIINDIHDNVINHRSSLAMGTLRARATKEPKKAMLIKNLVEATIEDQNVFETDERTINDIKAELSDLKKIALSVPSDEPKKDETKPESEEPKEGTNESGEKITISKDGGALYDLITSWSDIEKFKSALNGGNAVISGPINRSYNSELLLTNTGKTKGISTKFEITFGSEEEKRLISSFLNILDNFLNNEELFNKIPPELQKKLIDTFDMFLKRNKEVIDNNGDEAWTNIRNKFNDLKEKYTGSKETSDTQTDGDLIKNKLSTISTGDEETKESSNNEKKSENSGPLVITISSGSFALNDIIREWSNENIFTNAFSMPDVMEKRIDRAYTEESAIDSHKKTTNRSYLIQIKADINNNDYMALISNLQDTLSNIKRHPDLMEKLSDNVRKKLMTAFHFFFKRNKETIEQLSDKAWPNILNSFEELYSTYVQHINKTEDTVDEDKEDNIPNDNDDAVNEDSVNNDYIIDDSGIWYICGSMFPDEYTLKDTINHVDDFSKDINDIENRKTQTDKITDKTEIEKEFNRLIQALNIIEKGISFDNITNVAPLFVRVLKIIKEYTENSISISDSNPLHSKVTDIKDKVDKLISDYSALKPATPTDQNDSENTETTDIADESTPETSQNTDESSNQNGSENSDETKKQPEPEFKYPTISGFNGLSDLVSELVSSGSIKRIVKNKKSGVDIDKLIAKAYNAEKTLQNKGTLTSDNAVQVLSNSNDEEEVLEKINTALTNITSDIKHFNNLTSQSKTKLVAAFEIFLNRNKFSGNGTIIDLKRNISKSLSFIKAKSNVNTGSAITAAQDTTTPQNDIDSNQQDQNSPQTQQSQPESSPQPEPKSDDTDTKSVPTVSELIGNGDVDKVVEAYNQTASPSNKIDSGEISWFKDYQDQIKANNLGDVFNEFIKIHNIDLNGPMSKSSFGMLSSAAADSISCYKNQNDLNGFLLDQYSRFRSYPSRMQRIFDEAKKYAEMERILVILTDPKGEEVIPGTKSDVKSASDTTDDTKPKTLRWFIENPEVSVDYVNKNLLPKDDKYVSPIVDYMKKAMTTVRDNNLINVLEKYGNDTGKYKLDDELTWDNAEELSSDAKTLEYIHKYRRNDINEYLKNEYSDDIMTDSMKDRAFYLAKAYVELHGGPNELLKPDETMVSVTPAKTSTQSADNTPPKNTNQDGNNTPPTQTEMAKLKNHTLVHDVVTEANQRDEDGVPMITNDMETELKNASEEHLMDFIGHFITELTDNHTMIETIPFTRRNIITLAAYAKQANKLLKSQNNLRDFLTQQYGYYKDPAQQEYMYKMAKLFAQDYNISVVLTDPSGKKEYINPTATFN